MIDWKCTIDKCGKKAMYKKNKDYYCDLHWRYKIFGWRGVLSIQMEKDVRKLNKGK